MYQIQFHIGQAPVTVATAVTHMTAMLIAKTLYSVYNTPATIVPPAGKEAVIGAC